MADTKELVERLNGENPDKVVATDRLRMFAHDPETFEFDQHDALSLIPTIEEAADAISRLGRERDEARAEEKTATRIALNREIDADARVRAAEAELTTLRAHVARLEKALEPFAEIGWMLHPGSSDDHKNTMYWAVPTVGQFRRAKLVLGAALEEPTS